MCFGLFNMRNSLRRLVLMGVTSHQTVTRILSAYLNTTLQDVRVYYGPDVASDCTCSADVCFKVQTSAGLLRKTLHYAQWRWRIQSGRVG